MDSRRQIANERGCRRTSLRVVILAIWSCGSAAFLSAQGVPTQSVREAPCGDAVHAQAERAADHLQSWQAVYAYYRKYKRCGFDADAAEGLSESIARLLVDKWKSFAEGASLAQRDEGFREFLLAGVNATLGEKDLEAIRLRAADCPTRAGSLCEQVRKRANSALEEQK